MPRLCRQYDPTTRDVRFDAARASWRAGSPAAELVTAALATRKGEARRDPLYGVDLSRARTPAEYRAAVEAALARYVASGALRDLAVDATAEALPTGGAAMVVRVRCKGRAGEAVDASITYPGLL